MLYVEVQSQQKAAPSLPIWMLFVMGPDLGLWVCLLLRRDGAQLVREEVMGGGVSGWWPSVYILEMGQP